MEGAHWAIAIPRPALADQGISCSRWGVSCYLLLPTPSQYSSCSSDLFLFFLLCRICQVFSPKKIPKLPKQIPKFPKLSKIFEKCHILRTDLIKPGWPDDNFKFGPHIRLSRGDNILREKKFLQNIITGQNGVHLVREISPWSSQVL